MGKMTEKQMKELRIILSGLYNRPHILHESLYDTHDSMRDWHGILFEQYKLYVEMTDRISERRGHTNTFFISVTAALFAAMGTLTTIAVDDKGGPHRWALFLLAALVSFGGIAICGIWRQLLQNYQKLNTAKFEIINQMEKKLPTNGFSTEWKLLQTKQYGYGGLGKVESKIPGQIRVVFILTTVAFLALTLIFVTTGSLISR
jgi:hypothetical protein